MFRPVTTGDRAVLERYIGSNPNRLCDNTPGVLIMWREYFATQLEETGGHLYIRHILTNNGGVHAFMLPYGPDPLGAVEHILGCCEAEGIPPLLCGISEEDLALLGGSYVTADLYTDRNWYDYLYSAEDFATFSGRRFNGQRNHMNRFRKLYPDHRFEPVSGGNKHDIKAFLDHYYGGEDDPDPFYAEDREKTYEILGEYEAYGFTGGVLYAGNTPVAFTAGETIGDTLFIHIEKADRAYPGSYQTVLNNYVRTHDLSEVRFVNREEDVGSEGMRTSKLSYHPVSLLKKYILRIAGRK